MLMPSIFGENLFDDFFEDFPWMDDNMDMKKTEKKLYGRRAARLMKTDIKEQDNGYELVIDLPGFKKDEVSASLENGYLTISAAKGLDEEDKDKKSASTSVRNVIPEPAAEAFMLAMPLPKKISRANLNTVS